MNTIKQILAAVMTLLMISSCNTIHEFPDDNLIDSTAVNVDMSLTIIDLDFEAFDLTKLGKGLSKEDYDVH